MEYLPKNYANLNIIEGTFTPSTIKPYNNFAYWYWERTLFERAQSKIRINGWLPEWSGFGVKDFFMYVLLVKGFVGFINADRTGKMFGIADLTGKLNSFFQYTKFMLRTPDAIATQKTYTIGKDGAIAKLTPDLRGIWDIISHYSEKLALLDCSINGSIISAKLAKIMGASTKGAGEALKEAIDRINKGDIAVVLDKRIMNGNPKSANGVDPITVYEYFNKNNYLTSDLLQDQANILSAFDTEIGITSLPYQKKERMVVNEAESKAEESNSRLNLWIDTLNESFKDVNRLLGSNLSATINQFGKDGVDNGENDVMGD